MMKNFTKYAGSICLVLFTQILLAQPANDNVCNAIELSVDGSINEYDNTDATIETDEVYAPGGDCYYSWCGSNISNSMWFTFIAPTSGEVNVSTCHFGSFDTKIAVWDVGDCSNFSSFVLLGANDDHPLYCNEATYASTLDLNGLVAGNTYYIQMDSYNEGYGQTYNISVEEGNFLPPPPSYVKIINNSPDAAMNGIDLRVNGNFPDYYLDNFSFRNSTYFFEVPSGEPISITVNESNSFDDSSPLATFTETFEEGSNTILILDGIYSTSGYNPDYLSKPLSLYRYDNALNNTGDYLVASILFHQGATDAPIIDINETAPSDMVLVDDMSYGDFNGYQNFNTGDGNLTLQVTEADGVTEIESYVAPIQSNYWGGVGYTILSSGFLDPANNSDGPAFGLYAIYPYSGQLFELPRTGDTEYDDACNAAVLATDGTPLSLSNAGLGTQTDEPVPPYGSCYGNLSWCDYGIDNTIWAKFTAPASGLVTLTTCDAGTNFNTQIAAYSVSDCNDFSTYTLIGANDDQAIYCSESFSYGASTLPLCGLTPGEEYYVQVDGGYGAGGNFNLIATEGGTCYARVQFIHNSADLSIEAVDIRVNGDFLQDQFGYEYGNDLAFRSSTAFLNIPAGEELNITINPSDSNDDSNPIQSFSKNFTANTSQIAVIDGIAASEGYDPDNIEKPIELYYYDQALDFTGDYYSTELLFHHGVTDVASIDINEEGLGNIVSDLNYGEYNGYQNYSTVNNLTFEVTLGGGGELIDTYIAPLYSNYWGGSAFTILSSGFSNQENNSNGPSFGLYASYPWGGFLYPLPSSGDAEYDDACNAVLLPTTGAITSLSNLGLTAQENEPAPPAGNYNNFSGWGDNALNQTIWGKFIAPTSGEVTITTCSQYTTFNTQIAVYSATDCADFSTYSLLGANEDSPDYCPLGSYGASFLPLCGLTPGQTYYLQIDNAYYWELGGNFDITLTEGATCYARLQVINNCADALASNVDIRYSVELINGDLLNDYLNEYDDDYPQGENLSFREATSYLFVPSNTLFTLSVNPQNSENDDNAYYSQSFILDANTSNVIVMEGILSETGYSPGSIDSPFALKKISNTRETGTNFSNTDLIFYHGSADAPSIDINELSTGLIPFVNNLNFRTASDYLTLPTTNGYIFQTTLANFPIELSKEEANLNSLYLGGAAITVCLSGFDDPAANSNGPALGLWYAPSYGGSMIPFLKNNAVCDAVSIPNNGVVVDGTNYGATIETDEVSPVFGFNCETEWCDYSLNNSVWYKFIASSDAAQVTTCFENTYFDSQLAVWQVEQCGDYSTYQLKGAADNNACDFSYGAATAIACGLDSGQTYYVQVDGAYGYINNFKISVSPYEGEFCATGIDEVGEIGSLSIYPNPVLNGELKINFETTISGNSTIEVLDILGKKLQVINLGNIGAGKISRTLDISDLSNGLYFVNIIHNQKTISAKVEVQK